ncbi:hypothetical protein MD484_g7105, partial [Candolleomyces efflorescens]
MDSFTTIKPTHIPTDAEGGGTSGSGGYCVIFAKDIPADKEGGGTSGSCGYCVVFNKDVPADYEGGGTSGSGGFGLKPIIRSMITYVHAYDYEYAYHNATHRIHITYVNP